MANMLRYGWLISLVLLLPVLSAMGQARIPAHTGPVVDEARLLSSERERGLASQLEAHRRATGHQVAVLTVPTLQGEPIEAYSLEVARSWALGEAEEDNGVLILVAPEDRVARIEVGYGLEGTLPDVVVSRILRREMTPRFREGDFEGGIEAGVLAVLERLEAQPAADIATDAAAPRGFSIGAFLFFLFFLAPPIALAGIALLGYRWVRIAVFVLLLPFFFIGGCGIGLSVAAAGLGPIVMGGLAVAVYSILFWTISRKLAASPALQSVWKDNLLQVATIGSRIGGTQVVIRPSGTRQEVPAWMNVVLRIVQVAVGMLLLLIMLILTAIGLPFLIPLILIMFWPAVYATYRAQSDPELAERMRVAFKKGKPVTVGRLALQPGRTSRSSSSGGSSSFSSRSSSGGGSSFSGGSGGSFGGGGATGRW